MSNINVEESQNLEYKYQFENNNNMVVRIYYLIISYNLLSQILKFEHMHFLQKYFNEKNFIKINTV